MKLMRGQGTKQKYHLFNTSLHLFFLKMAEKGHCYNQGLKYYKKMKLYSHVRKALLRFKSISIILSQNERIFGHSPPRWPRAEWRTLAPLELIGMQIPFLLSR